MSCPYEFLVVVGVAVGFVGGIFTTLISIIWWANHDKFFHDIRKQKVVEVETKKEEEKKMKKGVDY